jgi:hypothetical protein
VEAQLSDQVVALLGGRHSVKCFDEIAVRPQVKDDISEPGDNNTGIQMPKVSGQLRINCQHVNVDVKRLQSRERQNRTDRNITLDMPTSENIIKKLGRKAEERDIPNNVPLNLQAPEGIFTSLLKGYPLSQGSDELTPKASYPDIPFLNLVPRSGSGKTIFSRMRSARFMVSASASSRQNGEETTKERPTNGQRTTKKRLVSDMQTRTEKTYTSGSAKKEDYIMKISQTPPAISNKEQLLAGLIASTKMLLVALSLVVLFFVLFVKAIVGFAMVALAALNMAAEWSIGLVASVQEVQEFCSFLAVR